MYVRHGLASAGCGERGAGVHGCRAGTPVCDLIPNAAGSRERDVGMVSPIGTFSPAVGTAQTSGGWQPCSAASLYL